MKGFLAIFTAVFQLRPAAPDLFAPQSERAPFVCPACGRGFQTESSIRAHRGYGVS